MKRQEDSLQQSCVYWFGLQYHKYCRLIHHSPNEAAYDSAPKQRAMGMQKGFPDIFIAVPRGCYHGLFVELKTPRGRVSAEQSEMLTLLKHQGYCCTVIRTVRDFIREVTAYMSMS